MEAKFSRDDLIECKYQVEDETNRYVCTLLSMYIDDYCNNNTEICLCWEEYRR